MEARMKLGPVHLIRDATFRKLHQLQNLWDQFSRALVAASRAGNPLADRVFEHAHGLLHSPLCARVPPAQFTHPPGADEADLRAAERVVAAYRRANADAADPPAPSMWDRISREKREFLTALARGDVPAVQRALARMLASDLTSGLGQVHPSHAELLRGGGQSHVHLRFTDTLVSLAEAVGAARVTHMIQDPAAHLQPLNRDLDALFARIETRLGFDPSFPAVGSAFGFRVAGRLATIDGLTHAYNAHRLRQLLAGNSGGVTFPGSPGTSNRLGEPGDVSPPECVFEIGGGYGCLALMAHRAGVRRYAIFDLPWVNALQGYFLIHALPEGTVRLYGEEAGEVRVLPYWRLDDEPADSCDVLVNTDSLPEMGHATAAGYMAKVRRVTRGVFLSVNQEAKADVPGVGLQQCVAELIAEAGGFRTESRQRYWMRQGYVEEVFRPER
jgi:hypothetical protein